MPTSIRFLFLVTICALTTSQQNTNGQSAPQSEQAAVEEFATAVLQIYQAKEVAKFLSLLGEPPPPAIIDQVVPGTPPYEQLFGENSRQWQAVDSWDGEFEEVVLDQQAFIVIRKQTSAFGPDNPDVLKCVRLKNEQGNWRFDKFYIAQQAQVAGPDFSEIPPESQLYSQLNDTVANIIRAYQQRDIPKIKALSVEKGPWALRGNSEKTESERLFRPSELEGVTDWQGIPGRTFTKAEAAVKFGESEKATHWLQLIKVGGQWKVKNIKIDSK